ncbi:bifunctional glycosyltransferase/CDP-glycerol:glycerophosphate glycerophosphotransferase [Campylobacter coli]|uniref:bifunctional glycosyltransferase/CDP-glycerol:glycerophosphate glycerophosphotransferase n=3 Tax=Campylobacter coli TaxID=195 RepID=UPI0012F0A1EE|nr:CDP-glycerol glycerophosphotransferase family protein [Campylobacter coli]ECR3400208.1 glycosyltransferase [Campylobacter coli]EDO6651409.1 glycosyltransferase [Campylobacter coli]EDO7372078.1 glycosyltransferase [Campylobacter coli]HED8006134.1 CDP-glycerol glycerophosphotransferase family protein [Campylobacter coli]HED8007125.1 CDP-glycerol glycerophosphotransferase family protein [Campylobacter coli]
MLKLSSENKKFIKVILDGFFRIYLAEFFSKFKPKKYKAFSKYSIVCPIYNVEKYLDDFFKSIIKQRLDFKNNIFIICVDDGSTDDSAKIIKKYQKKYPKNITYLYKANGGLSSARNYGLKFVKTHWLCFTDPDDFLNRDYFYEVDRNIRKYNNENISMLATNYIFYFEKYKIYKDNHPLNFKFKKDSVFVNKNLDDFIQPNCASVVFNKEKIKNIIFREELKPVLEDVRFVAEFLVQNINSKSIFLKNAKYFYRKRAQQNSIMDTFWKDKGYFLISPKIGTLYLLQNYKIYSFVQKVCIYHMFWQIKALIFNPEKLAILNNEEKELFKELLFENFKFIDSCNIKNFNLHAFDFFYKKGILNYFKNEDLSENIAFIESIDDKNDEILIKYYFNDVNHKTKILLDNEVTIVKHSKIRQYDLLDKIFLYEKRIWLKLKNDIKMLDIFMDSQKLKLVFNNNFINDLNKVLKVLNKQKKQRIKNSNLWLFADMSWRADDNAEHLYRYVMRNHPKQKIAFILSKKSIDYLRLKKEGFKLVDPKSFYFKYLIYKADKIISSHVDRYIFNALGGDTLKTKDFIFLQHGVIKDDLSRWLNQRKIDIFITSTKAEYDSIAGDFNHYKFSTKEVVLTGLARWDALIKNNILNTKQILIMPTWREYLSGKVQKYGARARNPEFVKSLYFQKWQEFLCSKELEKLAVQCGYSIVFIPHPQVRMYLEDFNLPSYIITSYKESMQELFCKSSLMITDYSSVAFEMAVLKKPVLYYQFDKDEFFAKHSYTQGYFDYERDGFGEVYFNYNQLLYYLKDILSYNDKRSNSCILINQNICKDIFKKCKL